MLVEWRSLRHGLGKARTCFSGEPLMAAVFGRMTAMQAWHGDAWCPVTTRLPTSPNKRPVQFTEYSPFRLSDRCVTTYTEKNLWHLHMCWHVLYEYHEQTQTGTSHCEELQALCETSPVREDSSCPPWSHQVLHPELRMSPGSPAWMTWDEACEILWLIGHRTWLTLINPHPKKIQKMPVAMETLSQTTLFDERRWLGRAFLSWKAQYSTKTYTTVSWRMQKRQGT